MIDRSIDAFASLVSSPPLPLQLVQSLRCGFSFEHDEGCRDRDVQAETALLPVFAETDNLRRAHFEPYINADAFISALHPDARPESLRTLAPGTGRLRLDGPQFERLNELVLNLDGDGDSEAEYFSDAKGLKPKRLIELHLPASLSVLELETPEWYRRPFVLSLNQSVQGLATVKIEGRSHDLATIGPFFHIQGPLVTSLVLAGEDLYISTELEPGDYPPEYEDPDVRAGYLNRFNATVPVIALCTQLKTLEIHDVHLEHLFRTQHPTLETIVLRVEGTVARLVEDGFMYDPMAGTPEMEDDGFDKVSHSIQDVFNTARFPQLKTIRYKDAKWSEITPAQTYTGHHPMGLEGSVAKDGLVLLDAAGKPWEDSLALEIEDERDMDDPYDGEDWFDEDEDEDKGGEAVADPLIL